jgi:hypothetical protein
VDHGRVVGAAAALAMALVSTTGKAAPPEAPSAGEGAEPGHSAPGRAECLGAHRAAQELKQSGKLVEAQQQLLICSSATCPGPVISDCGSWIAELEQATPTIVFEIEVNGKEATEAKLFVDRAPVADWSHAVKVNPGHHVVRAELPPFEPHEESVFMAEGRRMRLVSVKFASSTPAPQPPAANEPSTSAPTPPAGRPVPVVVYPLLGAGVAGLAGFAVFGGMGRAKQTELQQTCGSRCSDGDLGSMKTNYLIGDVSLGVGVAALVSAAVVYFTRPGESPHTASILSVEAGPIGGVARHNLSWGASATMSW